MLQYPKEINMNEIVKFYTISQVPNDVQRKNSRNVSLLYLQTEDEDITKVAVTENGSRNYYIYNKGNLILEKKDISDNLYYVISNRGKLREVKKQVTDIEVNDRPCELFTYQGRLQGLQVVKITFSGREEFENFKRPTWFKDELKNPNYEKGLGDFLSIEKE